MIWTVAKKLLEVTRPVNLHPDIKNNRWTWYFLGSGTLKKLGPKYGVQKAGRKKQGRCYSKREDAAERLLLLINNDPVFCTLLFAPHILDPVFFQVRQPTLFFKAKIVGADWLGE